jgi:hypothetical protein
VPIGHQHHQPLIALDRVHRAHSQAVHRRLW